MTEELKEVALVLSGGGARGAYHLGVLHYLDQHNIKVKAICATSIGAIIGTSYASGVSPKEQLELLKSKDVKKLFKFNWFRKSIFSINMNAPILQKMVPCKSIEELSIPLFITALDLDIGQEIVFSKGEIHTLCKASSALIPFFEPVIYNNTTYVDGGIINHIPFKPLQELKLPIIGVNLHPYIKNDTKHSLYAYVKRSIIAGMSLNTQAAKQHCTYFIESPELTNFSIFSLKDFDELFELGFNEAAKILG